MTILTERAMLVNLRVSKWGASKRDREVSEKVATDYNSDPTMGGYTKSLIVKDHLDKINKIAAKARYYLYEKTLPWLDEGARILPAEFVVEFMATINGFIEEFKEAVEAFVTMYPDYVVQAKRKLNGMFNPADYPDPTEIRSKFKMDLGVDKITSTDDFRINLDEPTQALIRAQIERQLNEAGQGALEETYRRMTKPIKHMIEALDAYGVDEDTGKVLNPFRDTLVENLRDLVAVLPAMNITGSNMLEHHTQLIDDKLCQVDPQELRDDPDLRNAINEEAKAILADITSVMS